MRDGALSKIIATLQGQIRGYIMRKDYKKMLDQRLALSVLQRNCRKYLSLRNWPWWKLYTKVKPLLSVARQEEEMKKLEEEFKKLKENLEKEEKLRKEVEDNNSKLIRGKQKKIYIFYLFKIFFVFKKKMIYINNWNLNEMVRQNLKNVMHD
jgi:myosin heavy chain 6/7